MHESEKKEWDMFDIKRNMQWRTQCSVRTDTYSYGVHTESASLRQGNK